LTTYRSQFAVWLLSRSSMISRRQRSTVFQQISASLRRPDCASVFSPGTPVRPCGTAWRSTRARRRRSGWRRHAASDYRVRGTAALTLCRRPTRTKSRSSVTNASKSVRKIRFYVWILNRSQSFHRIWITIRKLLWYVYTLVYSAYLVWALVISLLCYVCGNLTWWFHTIWGYPHLKLFFGRQIQPTRPWLEL